ncbi:Glycerophosphodiester phosphodiesterase GDPD6 [Zea mays]|uniref:glycerophosphodiester phosphodiesterase n=1 Tax=Zea mays TaxID=4577 RepID=A0A3L6DU53_MAIZE|nr:Glycerophosphodiester phosphodiesterase GDPD6 [Zea mays]
MRPSICCAPLFLLLLLHLAFARPLFPLPSKTKNEEKKPIQTFRPYNIAHRGSNGEIPEETAAAYMRAIEEGADFIESDILASKDGALICFHDVTLDDTTDVAKRKEFANRRRTYEVEWFNVTGWFVVDFTLEELKTLRVKQRYSFRDQQYNGMFSIITFEEFISIALDADRTVGIYPEIKDPVFINKHVKWADGKKFEDKFVDTLLKYGYKGQYMSENWLKQPLFIQSFAPTSIVHVSDFIDSPKVFLIDDISVRTQDTNQSYWEITSDEYLAYISKYVVGLGPWKDTIVPASGNYLMPPSDLVARAHAHNLQVHPYTYRNENQFLHFNFFQDPYNEYDFWINTVGVDGLFTDFTGTLHRYQELTSPHRKDETANSLLVKISQMISAYEGYNDMILNEYHEALLQLGESARNTFAEFKYAIQSYTSSSAVARGEVHPLTKYVMNYIKALTAYSKTLDSLLKDTDRRCLVSDIQLMANPYPNFTATAFNLQSVTAVLEANLEAGSRLYRDDRLQYIFMMNNIHYMVQKVKNSDLKSFLGDEWIRIHNRKLQQQATRYERASWNNVLSYLSDDGLCAAGDAASRKTIREEIKNFNLSFEEVYRVQKAWSVPDDQLRDDVRIQFH